VIALALFGALTVAWIAGEGAWTSPDRPAAGTLAWPTGLALLAVHALGIATRGPGAPAAIALGALLYASGIALRLWAIATLGDAFRTALSPQDGARVVASGPYRRLAHPSEVGLLAAAAGSAALLASPLAACAVVLLVPAMLVRCAREDAALTRCRSCDAPESSCPG
jgi:protein-S-isoprenylcysteine O-methyltransferase Ste14